MNITINLVKTVFDIGEGFYHDNPKESLSIKNGIISYTVGKSIFNKSVDAFFFMCKNYISKYVSNVGSGYDKDTNRYWCICNNGDYQEYSNSEQQAVFNMCEQVLSQNLKQQLKEAHWEIDTTEMMKSVIMEELRK